MARVYTAALLRLKGADKSPVGLLRPDSDSVDVEWGVRSFTSNKLPGHVDVGDPWATDPLIWNQSWLRCSLGNVYNSWAQPLSF